MSEQLTIEAAVAVLNEAKWRGLRWAIYNGHIHSVDQDGGLYLQCGADMIAIAQGILDARALVEARLKLSVLEPDVEQLFADNTAQAIRLSELTAEVEQLQATNTRLEAEFREVIETGNVSSAKYIADLEQQLTELRAERDALQQRLKELDHTYADNVRCEHCQQNKVALLAGRCMRCWYELEASLAALRSAAEPLKKWRVWRNGNTWRLSHAVDGDTPTISEWIELDNTLAALGEQRKGEQ